MRGGHVLNRWRAVFGFIGLCACGSSEASGPPGDAGAGGNAGAGATGGSSTGGSGGGAASSGSGGSAGSSGAGGSIAPDASPRAACRYYLEAACRRRAECAESEDLGCVPLYDLCPDYFFSPGSTRTIATLVSCAAEWATFDCGLAIRSGNPDCASRGTRQTGEECFFGSQCASLRCSASVNGRMCGTCLADIPVGSACASSTDCGLAQDCVAGRCATAPSQPTPPPPAAAGAPCTGRCVAGYTCVAPAGSSERRCAPLPGPGSPCVTGTHSCAEGAYCTTAQQCVAVPGAGAPCAYDYYGGAQCTVGTVCNRDTDPNGVCSARRALGESCRPAYNECIEGGKCNRDLATGGYRCVRPRDEGQSCTDQYDECMPATTCSAGRCAASGDQGIFIDVCGP